MTVKYILFVAHQVTLIQSTSAVAIKPCSSFGIVLREMCLETAWFGARHWSDIHVLVQPSNKFEVALILILPR